MDAALIAEFAETQSPYESSDERPPLPIRDNDPGAPELLRQANEFYRNSPWPDPYDSTAHKVLLGDARDLGEIKDESVELVVTSPPYFDLKDYASDADGRQLGRLHDYDVFLDQLDRVWLECKRILVPGGRICCVIGDILIPRKIGGRHRVLPLPADIQSRSRTLGLDNLTPILWFKIGNRTNEAGGGSSGYYGKPYQPGAIIKNDHEHLLLLRKPGGYRNTTMLQKALSMLQREEVDLWMRPVWNDIKGASLRDGHPAPFPVELAERLIRMFSFAGDTVLDPFAGSGSTAVAAIRSGRNSISIEVEKAYVAAATARIAAEARQPRMVGATSAVVVQQ